MTKYEKLTADLKAAYKTAAKSRLNITDALTNNSPETYFTIDENGIYHA